MTASTSRTEVLPELVAIVTAVLDPSETGRDEALDAALGGACEALGGVNGYDLAGGFGSVVVTLLDRLSGLSGRSREEWWSEIAGGLAACAYLGGDRDE